MTFPIGYHAHHAAARRTGMGPCTSATSAAGAVM